MKYTDSSLVDYIKISPNRNSPRNHIIDTITIHSLQGNEATVERIGNEFAQPSRQASCNYGIAYDGKIVLCCPESDRSWCSSNRANDHRAITIEVSTLAKQDKPRYKVYPAAFESLIKLLVDICKRNNIPKLLWVDDKNLIGQIDKQNMTIHRWFANTDCPGEDLYSRMGEIADKVNEQLRPKIKGDVNNDGVVDITDTTCLLNMLSTGKYSESADINGDGKVDVSDVTSLLDIMAGKEKEEEMLYRVQVGAYTIENNAKKKLDRLKQDGFDGFIVKSGLYFRVQVGAYHIKENAIKMKQRLKDKGYSVFIIEVKGD